MQGQDYMFVIPTDDADYFVIAYLTSAFVLKLLDLIHLIYTQVTADIFLIDWEKPAEGTHSLPNNDAPKSAKSSPSAFRTIFVANEWNEMQILRKVKPAITLLLLVTILVFFGVENLARFDTSDSLDSTYLTRGEFSIIFRFALAASLYIGIGESRPSGI